MTFFITGRLFFQSTLLSGLLLLVFFAPSTAQASCAAPPPVLWSYPSDGAKNIPTDAILIIGGGVAEVARDGLVLTPLGPGFAYDLGELEPLTEYTVQVTAADSSDAQDTTITFTTGDGPMDGDSPRATATAAECKTLQDWQVCFDTEPRESVTVELPDADVAAWALYMDDGDQRYPVALWPASCGRLELERWVEDGNLQARELWENGSGEDVEPTVIPEPNGSCTMSGLPSRSSSVLSWLAGLAAAGALLRRRRVHQL